jgi:hypothetical protein
MANYDPSNLVNFQAILTNRFNTEARKSVDAVSYLAIKEVSEIMLPSHKVGRTREDRIQESFTFSRTSRALSSGRSHNHTGTHGDSILLTPSWDTISDPFAISIKQADNNIFTFDQMFGNEIENSVKNMLDGQEARAQTFVFDNRSQVDVTTAGSSTWNAVNFVHEITESTLFGESKSGVTMSQIIDTVMKTNLLRGNYLVFCDNQAYDKFQRLSEQGNANADNTAFQMGNKRFIRSIGMSDKFVAVDGTYTKGNFLAVPVGDIAHLDQIPIQNMQNKTTRIQTYGSLMNPIDGLDYALHHYEQAVDGTSTNGYTQDEELQYELSIDSSYVVAPLTTANETPIHAFSLK